MGQSGIFTLDLQSLSLSNFSGGTEWGSVAVSAIGAVTAH